MTEYYKTNIDLVCKRFGMSRDKLGEHAGLGRGAVASYVIGNTKPSVQFLFMLEQMTGIIMSRWMFVELTAGDIPDRPRQGWKFILPDKPADILRGDEEAHAYVASSMMVEGTEYFRQLDELRKEVVELKDRVGRLEKE